MVEKAQLRKKSEFLWEIPQSIRNDMRVPAHVYASEAILDAILQDDSLNQLMNVATLPGIQKAAIAMPDAHQGVWISYRRCCRDRISGRSDLSRRYRLRYKLWRTTAIDRCAI